MSTLHDAGEQALTRLGPSQSDGVLLMRGVLKRGLTVDQLCKTSSRRLIKTYEQSEQLLVKFQLIERLQELAYNRDLVKGKQEFCFGKDGKLSLGKVPFYRKARTNALALVFTQLSDGPVTVHMRYDMTELLSHFQSECSNSSGLPQFARSLRRSRKKYISLDQVLSVALTECQSNATTTPIRIREIVALLGRFEHHLWSKQLCFEFIESLHDSTALDLIAELCRFFLKSQSRETCLREDGPVPRLVVAWLSHFSPLVHVPDTLHEYVEFALETISNFPQPIWALLRRLHAAILEFELDNTRNSLPLVFNFLFLRWLLHPKDRTLPTTLIKHVMSIFIQDQSHDHEQTLHSFQGTSLSLFQGASLSLFQGASLSLLQRASLSLLQNSLSVLSKRLY